MYAEASAIDDAETRKRLIAWATQSESEARLRAAVKLAETEREIIVRPDELDADPWLFNAANGTIDLRDRDAARAPSRRPDDADHDGRLRRRTRAPTCGTSSSTGSRRVTQTSSRSYRRAVGYSLSGHTSEEVLFFAHGPTATGKSSKLEAIRAVLGEYAATADFETFLKRHGDAGIRNDVARLAEHGS